MWGFRTLQSLWAEMYHFWLAEVIQRSPHRRQRRVRQGRTTRFRARQHDSHYTGIWISSSYVVTCEAVKADRDFSGKLKRTARYSKSPSWTAVKGQNGAANESGNIFDFGVRTSPFCGEVEKTSNLHTVFGTQSYFPSQRQKIVLQTWGQHLNMPAKDKLGENKRKKNKSQVESFGTKAEILLAGLME